MKLARFDLRLTFVAAACAAMLAGCGLAETTSVAASEAETAAQQAKEGKKLEDKVQKQLDAANKAAAEQRDQAEAASQ